MKTKLLSIAVAAMAFLTLASTTSVKADAIPDNIDQIIDEASKENNKTEDVSSDYADEEIFTEATVNVHMLNMRSGAGTDFSIIHVLNKGDKLKVFGKFNDWYIAQSSDTGHIGCVNSYYVTLKSTNGITQDNNSVAGENETETLLRLINEVRAQSGLAPLTLSNELSNVALHKAMDMVENNYFSHNSPTYGTPFEMMKKYGISFKTAAENIAGNQSAAGAAFAWTNSEGHLANILNEDYETTGIGIYTSPVYGKIYVQLFIG